MPPMQRIVDSGLLAEIKPTCSDPSRNTLSSTRIATNRNDYTVDLIIVSVKRAQVSIRPTPCQVTSAMMSVSPHPYHLI